MTFEYLNETIISISVLVGILIVILIGLFIFQCYHRGCLQILKEKVFKEEVDVDRFSLLSYNLCLRAPTVSNLGDDYKNIRLELFIQNVLDQYDIVCLQDVIGAYSPRRGHLVESASELGLKYSLVSITPMLPCFICDGGLIILSRIPLVKRDQYVFTSRLYPDSLLSRGVLYSKLSPNAHSCIHLFNTHIFPAGSDEESKRVHLNQINECVDYVKKMTANDNYPIILCGDFSVNALQKAETVVDLEHWENNDNSEDTLDKPIIKYVEEQTDEYIQLIYKLTTIGQVKDVIFNGLNRHPITTGDTYFDRSNIERPLETILTKDKDLYSKKCEDYIFLITRGQYLQDSSPYVHTFDVENEDFQFLSNHYGLSVDFVC